jgi:sialic acid synthase SpsE
MGATVKIGWTAIGGNCPAYIIAEAGSNHNNDFQTAKKLIREAARAGADAIKFQAFRADNHYSRHTPGFTYLESQGHRQSTYEIIRALEINRDWHGPLIEYSKECGITFLSSPCDVEAIDQLAGLGMEAFKVASFDLPDVHLISRMAQYGRPVILSTGLADYEDIQHAIAACRRVGNEKIILLQCTSLYPAPPALSNLNAMKTMQRSFGFPVGYSDHTLGDHVAIAAVANGACMIEKHFTLDRTLPGPDHEFAIEPRDLADMIRKIREVESALGDGIKNGPRPEEQEMYEKGRRSLHAKKGLSPGDTLTRDVLVVKRPGYGIPPRFLDKIVGRKVCREIPEDRWITWEDLK